MNLRLLLPLLMASASYAATVITATCDSIVADGSCRSENPAGYGSTAGSSASGSVNLQLASNPADWSTLSTRQSAVSHQGLPTGPDSAIGPGSSTTISIEYGQSVITDGAERPGYLQIQGGGVAGYFYDGSAGMTSGFTINPFTGSSFFPNGMPVTQIRCSANDGLCTPGSGYYSNFYRIPVTLGITLTLVANGRLTNRAVFNDGVSGGDLSTTFQFRFFEVDGTTPVAVRATPEPSTAAMLVLPLLAVGLFRFRQLWENRRVALISESTKRLKSRATSKLSRATRSDVG